MLNGLVSGFNDRDLNTSTPVESNGFVETLHWTNVNCPMLLCASGTPALGFVVLGVLKQNKNDVNVQLCIGIDFSFFFPFLSLSFAMIDKTVF